MKVKIENNTLFIEMPLGTPAPSKSGKTKVIASTHGATATAALVDGKPLIINLNAYVK